MPATPAVSVVVTCHNPGPLLPPTLASIREQRGLEPEIIVIDQGSTDGSRAWLTSESPRLTPILAESVTNTYTAMNQGIAAARGEWLLFLRAGDRLIGDRVLSETINWTRKTEAGVVAGEVAFDDGRIMKFRSRVNPLAGNFLPASGTFYRASLFVENGGFDASLSAQADYEFNVRLWKGRVRFKPIPLRIAASHSRPDKRARSWDRHREEIVVRHRYFSFPRCLPWDAVSILRWAGGKLAGIFARPR